MLCVLIVEGMSVVVNVRLSLMSVFCLKVKLCHWLQDGKLWCNEGESREGGRERTIIRIQTDFLCRM